MINKLLTGLTLALALFALTACQSSEERAEEHYKTALQHIENGDYARAKVEFQNVFKLNGQHREARARFAQMQIDAGETASAYSQYLRLVEQFPDDLEGRKALAQMSLDNANWDELKRHGEYLAELAPDDFTARASVVALSYRDAVLARDETTRQKAFDATMELLKEDPQRQGLRRLVIDDFIRLGRWNKALEQIDAAIALDPKSISLQQTRLGVLYQINDPARIEAQLMKMIAAFPKDNRIVGALVQWYISHDALDKAETLLRNRVDPKSKDSEAGATLVQFLAAHRGNEVALNELNTLIDSGVPQQAMFKSLRASVKFDLGQRDQAIAEMQALLEQMEPSADTDSIKVSLAHMLEVTGNFVGARALVEEVLERDSTHTEALKKRARWLISDDKSGDAIVTLRTALAGSPDDPEIMTLMASAHERDGNRELMAEMLALAVENSGSAPAESLRYAALLVQQEKYRPAEDILLAALRKDPENIPILVSLGDLYLKMQDWGRNEGVVSELQSIGTERATSFANDMTARRLASQDRQEELNAFLGSMSDESEGVDNADIAIIRLHLKQNAIDKALEHVNGLLETAPDAPLLRFVKAAILAQAERTLEAEELYVDLLDENDQSPEVWIALYRLQNSSGEQDKAKQTLMSARSKLPDNLQLLWLDAGRLEKEGDIDGALSIYETLYAANSSNQIIANNLASLLADHRSDTESLERAYTVARRLRGTNVAPFQDTYGWIAYRLQNYDEAVEYLEPAASAMTDNAAVQFHLAMAYASVNRLDEALAQFEKVKAMLDPNNLPEFAGTIDTEISRLTKLKAEQAQ